MFDEEKTEDVTNVTVTTYHRDFENSDYVSGFQQAGTKLIDVTQGIGWMFPDGSSALDKVVVDGREFTDFSMAMKDTGVKEGSVVDVYKTSLQEEEDVEDEDDRRG